MLDLDYGLDLNGVATVENTKCVITYYFYASKFAYPCTIDIYCTLRGWIKETQWYCIFHKVARVLYGKQSTIMWKVQYSYANSCYCSRCEIPICHNSNY